MELPPHEPSRELARLLRWLHGLLAAGLVGTVAELLLGEHYEEPLQLVPLVAAGLALAALGWHARRPGRGARRALAAAWLLLGAAGLAGLVLHFRENLEFQRELAPDLGGLSLVFEALRSTSPPSLAPGALTLLAAVGLLTLGAAPPATPDPGPRP